MTAPSKEMFPFPIIRKRDGRMTRFDIGKVASAIDKAFYACGSEGKRNEELAQMVVQEMVKSVEGSVPHVEEIQDEVERVLIREGFAREAKAFILYRAKRTSIRDGKSELMDSVESILRETHKDGPGALNSPSSKMLRIAAAASRNFYLTRLIPSQFAEAHIKGDVHIHDLDYYGKTLSSLQIPLKKLLESGFFSGHGYIRPPRRYSSIGALIAIIIQSCQNDLYGGQSIPEFDTAVSSYARENLPGDKAGATGELFQAMEGLVYNLNMMYSRMGAQVPASTINLGLDTTPGGRAVTESLLEAMSNGLGRGETPLFPWVIFQVKDGVNSREGDPNYDLYQKAVRVASRRMNPSFAFLDSEINRAHQNVAYWGDGSRAVPEMSGRFAGGGDSAGGPWGWGNIAQATINLPRIAFKTGLKRRDLLVDSFYSELRRVLDLLARQMLHRRDVLSSLRPVELPFVMGEKVYAGTDRLADDESILNALQYGIMTVGIAGLAEAVYLMHGRDHGQDPARLQFALEIIDFINKNLDELSREFQASIILSASSSGYASQRFAQLDRIEFGITPRVNDKKFYHQGFSIPTDSEIPWQEKLEIEGKFHSKIPGGHFTYLEAAQAPTPELYHQVLAKMKESGIALGGISFPLHESLNDGSTVTDPASARGRVRTLRRAAGLLLPFDRINEALKNELESRRADL
jgi:ribonucleoside-triphosphate reductase